MNEYIAVLCLVSAACLLIWFFSWVIVVIPDKIQMARWKKESREEGIQFMKKRIEDLEKEAAALQKFLNVHAEKLPEYETKIIFVKNKVVK